MEKFELFEVLREKFRIFVDLSASFLKMKNHKKSLESL